MSIDRLREARDVLLRAMQDEGITGRRRQRIEDAADGMVRAALAAEADRATCVVCGKPAAVAVVCDEHLRPRHFPATAAEADRETPDRPRYTAYVDGRQCHNCGLEPYRHECPEEPR